MPIKRRCRLVADNDGDSPDLLATTTTVQAFSHWPAATTANRGDAERINTVSKLGQTIDRTATDHNYSSTVS